MSILGFLREVISLSVLLGVLYGWSLVGNAFLL
jgi:hypothetical protein